MRSQARGAARRFHNVEPLDRRRLLSLTPQGPEFPVNAFTTGAQTVPAIAADAAGNFVVAWQSDDQDGSGAGIVARRFDLSGVPLGGDFVVNTYTTGAQTSPAVAMDADGDFVVAWSSDGQDGALTGIYAQRFNSTGAPQGAEFHVNTFTTNRQSQPAVATNDAGSFVIVWQSSTQDGNGEGIYAQRYDAAGAPQGGESRVNTFTLNNQTNPSVACDAIGNFVVAWDSNGQDGSGQSIHARLYDAAGVAQTGEFRVNAYTTDNQRAASVARDADGDFVVAWESDLQDGSHLGVFARRFDASGNALADDFRVNTTTTSNQSAASVAMDDSGDFVVAWRSPDDNGFGVFAQGYFASGAPNDVELPVNTVTLSVQTLPAVAMDADGDAVIAWQSFGQDGGSYGVYARRYRILPGVLGSDFIFETAPQRLTFAFDDDVSASLGTDDIVLQNLTTQQTIPATELTVSYDVATNTATFTYIGAPAGGVSGVLPDGNYRATLLAAGITTPGGTPLPADYVREFFFLNADANRDARVTLADFNTLAANFGQSGRTFSQGNFDYDAQGQVNLSDFNLLAARFGAFVAPVALSTRAATRIASEIDLPDRGLTL
jgi:hypothetical protein